MKNKKIIQISTTNVDDRISTQCNFIITALCQDGSIWINRDMGNWEPINSIPDKKET